MEGECQVRHVCRVGAQEKEAAVLLATKSSSLDSRAMRQRAIVFIEHHKAQNEEHHSARREKTR